MNPDHRCSDADSDDKHNTDNRYKRRIRRENLHSSESTNLDRDNAVKFDSNNISDFDNDDISARFCYTVYDDDFYRLFSKNDTSFFELVSD